MIPIRVSSSELNAAFPIAVERHSTWPSNARAASAVTRPAGSGGGAARSSRPRGRRRDSRDWRRGPVERAPTALRDLREQRLMRKQLLGARQLNGQIEAAAVEALVGAR